MKTREELKKDAAREEWKKSIVQAWRRTEADDQKTELGPLILNFNSQSNNTQLLNNGVASSKPFILFKLFLPKSKNITLAFLLTN